MLSEGGKNEFSTLEQTIFSRFENELRENVGNSLKKKFLCGKYLQSFKKLKQFFFALR